MAATTSILSSAAPGLTILRRSTTPTQSKPQQCCCAPTSWSLSSTNSPRRSSIKRIPNSTPRPCLPRASVGRTSEQSTSSSTAQERESLKTKLFQQMEAASGNLTEDCVATILELEKLSPNPEPWSKPELYAGYWEQIKAGFKGTGRSGESKAEIGYGGAAITLGRATFNAFKPVDIEIVMKDTHNYVEAVVGEEASTYAFIVQFTTKNPKGDELPPIEGLIINESKQSVQSSVRMGVVFERARLRPCYPERDLEAWKLIFGEANEGMDENGQVTVDLPNPYPGHYDILYLDEEIRITKGNMGSYVVVGRLVDPPRFAF